MALRFISVIALALTAIPLAHSQTPAAAQSLFNGKDLTGWETYLGKPSEKDDVPGLKKNANGKYAEPLGINRDPFGVFSVVSVDEKPAIRISGQVFGAITSKDEFENYHLRLEVKWGEKKWPPKDKAARDSGLLYHCVGPHGAGSGFWMKSLECQIQENDFGDFWSVDGVIVDVHADRKTAKDSWVYRPDAELRKGVTERIIRNPQADHLEGWNVVEVYAFGTTSVHVINGKTNLVLTNLRQKLNGKGEEVPLAKGKIQLQSEGAEVYYRNITVQPIDRIPGEVMK